MNLTEATFDDIMNELSTRYQNVVLIGHREKFEDDRELQRYRYCGNPNVVLGLLTTVEHSVIRDKENDTVDDDNPT